MSVTPMMQQYLDAKQAAGDALLLFRMGDFYECFFEDAKTVAKVLGLTLTSRDKGENPIPMAGFPHHQLENYLARLISAGYRAAVCEQVEDPKKAVGIVKREVTRIVTPGTLTDDALLDPRQSNFLVAVVRGSETKSGAATKPGAAGSSSASADLPRGVAPPGEIGLAWVELSTGHFFAATISAARLADELARIGAAEILVPEGDEPLPPHVRREGLLTKRPDWSFGHAAGVEALTRQFGTLHLEGFGFGDGDTLAIRAAGGVLDYLRDTQRATLVHLDRLQRYSAAHSLQIDEATRRSLEITRTLREGRREGSLLAAIDRTVCPLGSRLLGAWMASPLANREAIVARHEAVAEFVGEPALLDGVREHLRGIYDLERLLARVSTGRASPRDLSFILRTLRGLPALKARLTARRSELLCRLEGAIDLCHELRAKLDAALVEDCTQQARDGGFIKAGFHSELDTLRDLAAGGKQWIANYQAELISTTGISTLKVGYNKVFGYYIEVTNTNAERVPANFLRKQTVKNAERYFTPELKEYEEKVLTADERSKEVEYDCFLQLRQLAADEAKRLHATAGVLAELDVLAALAQLARERGYCRPKLVDEPLLEIVDGRHPVLDLVLASGSFVPNDTLMNEEAGRLCLITGPNMAGKSTYIRQVALTVLLAQIGSFVPAKEATIGVADALFARVGASDELSRGQSTFMVEMTETARILHLATPRSLVILDEIGRGTSTYDGVSLAWAVVEYLHERVDCRTLFATHYHELCDLATTLRGVRNLNVAVREWEDQVIFLHKIIAGAADKSYGIHVARLAGIPTEVNERAKQILAQLEAEHLDPDGRPKIAATRVKIRPRRDLQLTLFGPEPHPLLDEIRALEVDQLTPLAALQLVSAWRERLEKEKK